jgi:ABC-2 type transport system permease protein
MVTDEIKSSNENKKVAPAKRTARQQSIVKFLLWLLILVSANVITSFVFVRMDLTGEKRFSLAPSSISLLKKLNDVVTFKIYLEGDLPPSFKRLRNSIEEMLAELKAYSNDNVEYQFIDPAANADKKERNELYKQLQEKGIQPTNIEERNKSGTSQKIIFPGAVITYRGQETSVLLLKNKIGSTPEEMLNTSIESLEFELMNVIRKLTVTSKPRIGFLQGQGELSTQQVADAASSLSEYYQVDTIEIKNNLSALKNYKALIIAKPTSAFDEKDKFILDQFIMKGGRVLWLVETMQMNMDSLSATNTNIALAIDLNFSDQLFKYGVRVNDDLVLDLQAAPIPVVTGMVGNKPQQSLFPWYYFPLVNPISKNPIVHNLNAIKFEFAGSLDTVEAEGIKKTILLSTSPYSRTASSPARVSLNILKEEPDPTQFNRHDIPVAVLLEGNFKSLYANRVPKEILNDKEIGFRAAGDSTKMIVVSDGDVIANFVNKKGTMLPLGYDRYTGQIYGNKNFILNCMDYLCDNEDVVALRSKEFKIRLLDKAKTENRSVVWLAMLLPVFIIMLYGIIHFYIRRKKYA